MPLGVVVVAPLAQVVVAVVGVLGVDGRRFAVGVVHGGDGIVVGRRGLRGVGLRFPAVLAGPRDGRRDLAESEREKSALNGEDKGTEERKKNEKNERRNFLPEL